MTKTEFQMYIHGKIAIEDDQKYMHPTSFEREEEDGCTYLYHGVEFDVEGKHVCVFYKFVDDVPYFFAEVDGAIVAKSRATAFDSMGYAYDNSMQIYVEIHKYLYGHDNYTEYLH